MTLGSRLHDNDEITEHTEYILPETALKSLGIFLGLTAINDTTHFFSFGNLLNEQMDTALQLSHIYIYFYWFACFRPELRLSYRRTRTHPRA